MSNDSPPLASIGRRAWNEHRVGAALLAFCALGIGLLLWLFELPFGAEPLHDLDLQWSPESVDDFFGICALGTALVVGAGAVGLRRHPNWTKVFRSGLAVIFLLSAFAWMYGARGIARPQYVKVWDSFHYVLGPKYFNELDYFGLYDCAAVAGAESKVVRPDWKIRDLKSYRAKTIKTVLANNDCRARFSPERWQEFKHDVAFYAKAAGSNFKEMLNDHGYNGTPFHALLSGFTANLFELNETNLILWSLLDTFGILLALYFVGRWIGWEVAALVAIYFFTAFTDRAYYIQGSFFRYYWFVPLVIGIAAIARRRYWLAGALISTAAMLNVFPLLFLIGIGAKATWSWLRGRGILSRYRRFIGATIATAVVLGGLTLFQPRAVQNYAMFLHDMQTHTDLITRSRIGFRNDFLFNWETSEDSGNYIWAVKNRSLKSSEPASRVIAGAIVALCVFLALRLPDLEASVLTGFGSFFFIFSTVEYYYGIAALLLVLARRRLHTIWGLTQVGVLFLLMSAVYWAWHETAFLWLCNSTLMSVLFTLYLLGMLALMMRRTWSCNTSELRSRLVRLKVWSLRIGYAGIVLATLGLVAWVTPPPPRDVERSPGPVVVFGGDVSVGRRVNGIVSEHGPRYPFEGLDLLPAADLAVVNLECVIADVGELNFNKAEDAPYHFRGRPELVEVLTSAGIDVVATANNHSLDYGDSALMRQKAILEQAGIQSAGSGADLEQSCAPTLSQAGALTVAVFSVDATQPLFAAASAKPGTCFLPLSDSEQWRVRLESRIAAAHKQAHIVLVAVHWGSNFTKKTSPEIIRAGHALIDAGADAVLGSSSHVLHGIEAFKGRPIIYDAGNLLFDLTGGSPSPSALFSLVLQPEGVKQVWVTPVAAHHGYSRPAEGDFARNTLLDLKRASAEVGTRLHIQDDQGVVDLEDPPARALPNELAAHVPPVQILLPEISKHAPPECVVDSVPESAKRDPLPIGPFELLGVTIDPDEVIGRKAVTVTTYWQVTGNRDRNYLFDLRTARVAGNEIWHNRHEGCDWIWPTDRWQSGIIYRDRVTLRPPNNWKITEETAVPIVVQLYSEDSTVWEPADLGRLRVQPK